MAVLTEKSCKPKRLLVRYLCRMINRSHKIPYPLDRFSKLEYFAPKRVPTSHESFGNLRVPTPIDSPFWHRSISCRGGDGAFNWSRGRGFLRDLHVYGMFGKSCSLYHNYEVDDKRPPALRFLRASAPKQPLAPPHTIIPVWWTKPFRFSIAAETDDEVFVLSRRRA